MTPLSSDQSRILMAKALTAIDVMPGLGAFFKLEFLWRHSFVSAIFGCDFKDKDKMVSKVCSDRSIKSLYCASFDNEANLPSFRFLPSHENLKSIRERYHQPSYIITDNLNNLIIVSDSDYFWEVASSICIVERISVTNIIAHLDNFRSNNISTYGESDDQHDLKIANMLSKYCDICVQSNKQIATL